MSVVRHETRDTRHERRAEAAPSRRRDRPHACVGCFGQTAMGGEKGREWEPRRVREVGKWERRWVKTSPKVMNKVIIHHSPSPKKPSHTQLAQAYAPTRTTYGRSALRPRLRAAPPAARCAPPRSVLRPTTQRAAPPPRNTQDPGIICSWVCLPERKRTSPPASSASSSSAICTFC